MNRTKKIILLVLLGIVIVGIIGLIVGTVLGADTIQIGRSLLLQTADSFKAQFGPIAGKLTSIH